MGARNYPIRTPTVSLHLRLPNSLMNSAKIFDISGLYDATVSEDMKVIHFYGYNPERWLGIWHKYFGPKIDLPCRLDAFFFQEDGPISISAVHPSLHLYFTVSEHNAKQLILISYERDIEFSHGGHFIENERIINAFWISYLPLFSILTESGIIKIIGPEIKSVPEDINSYTSMLRYTMITCIITLPADKCTKSQDQRRN